MSSSKHISDTELYEFKQDHMDKERKENLLEHICSCDFCSDRFTAILSENVIMAPKDLKENILNATRNPVTRIALKAKEAPKNLQFFIYSLKVGTATVAALLLLVLSVNLTDNTTFPREPEKAPVDASYEYNDRYSLTAVIRDSLDTFSNSMSDLTNNIMKTEVTDYDQKEK